MQKETVSGFDAVSSDEYDAQPPTDVAESIVEQPDMEAISEL